MQKFMLNSQMQRARTAECRRREIHVLFLQVAKRYGAVRQANLLANVIPVGLIADEIQIEVSSRLKVRKNLQHGFDLIPASAENVCFPGNCLRLSEYGE